MSLLDDILSGGRPGLTMTMKKEYDRYAADTMSTGATPLSWESWLDQNGYVIGNSDLVQPKPMRGNGTLRNGY